MDEVKLLPCEEAVARERERIMEIHRSAVMETFKLMLGAGMPGGKPHERQKTRWIIKGFEMATDAIRRAIDESAEATRPPIVTDEVVERDDATLLVPREGLEDALFDSLYDSCELMGVATRKAAKGCVAAIEAHAAAMPTIDQDGGEAA